MAIIITSSGSADRPQIEPGTHFGICYRVCDIGTQPDSGYGPKHKVILSFELPNERVNDNGVDKPAGISYIQSASLHEKSNFRKDLERWRGKAFAAQELLGFDLAKLLGQMCMLSVSHNSKGKSVVTGLSAVPKGTPRVEPYNPLVEWSVSQGQDATYQTLPDFIKKMAAVSLEWTKAAAVPAAFKAAAGPAPATPPWPTQINVNPRPGPIAPLVPQAPDDMLSADDVDDTPF